METRLDLDPQILRFGLSIAIGLLIGGERGWHERDLPEGMRVAGVRTFGVVGMLGGLWGLLAEELGENLLGFAFLAVAGTILAIRLRAVRETKDYGATTVVAALLTFALGAVAMRGHIAIAAAGAVITTILLGTKPVIHRVLGEIRREEIYAVFKLLVMTVVMLPVLPNRGFGPWQALNPFEIWLMIVLICGISFLGYIGVRVFGARRGLMFGALAGGLASSTAVAVSYARIGRDNPALDRVLACGIILASATAFPRIIILASIISQDLAYWLIWPLGIATGLCLVATAVIWRKSASASQAAEVILRNPFDFEMALKFGVLLIATLMLTRAFSNWFGDLGVYVAALFAGLADVDAISLSLARMAGEALTVKAAAAAIVTAALSNIAFKAGAVGVLGGLSVWRFVAPAFALVIVGAVSCLYFIDRLHMP